MQPMRPAAEGAHLLQPEGEEAAEVANPDMRTHDGKGGSGMARRRRGVYRHALPLPMRLTLPRAVGATKGGSGGNMTHGVYRGASPPASKKSEHPPTLHQVP